MIKNPLLILLTVLLLAACKKPAGEGGNSRIHGKILVEDWNVPFTVKNGEYPGADEDVYIIYGDDLSYSDRVRANYNGEYEFRYLNKGKYRIYVYSKDRTFQSPSGETAVVKDVSISKNRQDVEVEQFVIYD
jgi:hypothetical protein